MNSTLTQHDKNRIKFLRNGHWTPEAVAIGFSFAQYDDALKYARNVRPNRSPSAEAERKKAYNAGRAAARKAGHPDCMYRVGQRIDGGLPFCPDLPTGTVVEYHMRGWGKPLTLRRISQAQSDSFVTDNGSEYDGNSDGCHFVIISLPVQYLKTGRAR